MYIIHAFQIRAAYCTAYSYFPPHLILMQAHELPGNGVVGEQIVSGLLHWPRYCGSVHVTKLPRGG